MRLTAIILAAALSGCSTIHSAGIGGEPVLACSFRDSKAFIDDRLLGSDEVHLGLARRFKDGDSLCVVK
jgi:uncharacterized protein YceK